MLSSSSRYCRSVRADVLLLLRCCLRRIDRTSGQVVERHRYTSFGELTIEDDQGNALQESAFGNDRFFLGRPYDRLDVLPPF